MPPHAAAGHGSAAVGARSSPSELGGLPLPRGGARVPPQQRSHPLEFFPADQRRAVGILGPRTIPPPATRSCTRIL